MISFWQFVPPDDLPCSCFGVSQWGMRSWARGHKHVAERMFAMGMYRSTNWYNWGNNWQGGRLISLSLLAQWVPPIQSYSTRTEPGVTSAPEKTLEKVCELELGSLSPVSSWHCQVDRLYHGAISWLPLPPGLQWLTNDSPGTLWWYPALVSRDTPHVPVSHKERSDVLDFSCSSATCSMTWAPWEQLQCLHNPSCAKL